MRSPSAGVPWHANGADREQGSGPSVVGPEDKAALLLFCRLGALRTCRDKYAHRRPENASTGLTGTVFARSVASAALLPSIAFISDAGPITLSGVVVWLTSVPFIKASAPAVEHSFLRSISVSWVRRDTNAISGSRGSPWYGGRAWQNSDRMVARLPVATKMVKACEPTERRECAGVWRTAGVDVPGSSISPWRH